MDFLVIACILLALYYVLVCVFLYNGLLLLPQSGDSQDLKFSVVIAAHNEEALIGRCLETVLHQTIHSHRFEVIVVDDRSTDQTADIVRRYTDQFENLRLIQVFATPAGISPKKHAVSEGIAAASNEIIVQTDADCVVPDTWLDTLDKNFAADVGLVQGITTYEKVPGMNPVFFGLQTIDFISHNIVAAAAIGANLPINSNANNLAYRKKAYVSVGDYGELRNVVSGDDDLLLQRIWKMKQWDIRFMTDPAGRVFTKPTSSSKGVVEQRKRWGSKTIYYNKRQIAFLASIFIFYCSFVLCLGLSAVNPFLLWIGLFMFAAKLAGEFLVMFRGLSMFGQRRYIGWLPVASALQSPVILFSVFAGVFGKFEWKGRRYKRSVETAGG